VGLGFRMLRQHMLPDKLRINHVWWYTHSGEVVGGINGSTTVFAFEESRSCRFCQSMLRGPYTGPGFRMCRQHMLPDELRLNHV
jgi:hypothetical protein